MIRAHIPAENPAACPTPPFWEPPLARLASSDLTAPPRTREDDPLLPFSPAFSRPCFSATTAHPPGKVAQHGWRKVIVLPLIVVVRVVVGLPMGVQTLSAIFLGFLFWGNSGFKMKSRELRLVVLLDVVIDKNIISGIHLGKVLQQTKSSVLINVFCKRNEELSRAVVAYIFSIHIYENRIWTRYKVITCLILQLSIHISHYDPCLAKWTFFIPFFSLALPRKEESAF